ncbi:MAG: hypothetical protein IKE59_03895 [Erysipelotrichaceae bacterium]|nr:hypothetical protein [Erysipelotrichaceae bacterium]
MNYRYLGYRIQTGRQKKRVQRKVLCEGICDFAMLKKIEAGKMQTDDDIILRLLKRLEINGAEEDSTLKEQAEAAYSLFFLYHFPELSGYLADHPEIRDSVYALDYELLWNVLHQGKALSEEMESYMDKRQLSVQYLLKNDPEAAAQEHPAALYHYLSARMAYKAHRYEEAKDRFAQTYAIAAIEGSILLMLRAKTSLGKVYARLMDADNMKASYDVARRIAKALNDEKTVGWINYHEASVQIELGNYAEAYRYFRSLQDPSVMEVYKMAVLAEKMNRKDDLKEALKRLEEIPHPSPTQKVLFATLRYRYDHTNYWKKEEYQNMMEESYERLRRHYPREYLLSFLPDYLDLLEKTDRKKEAEELRSHYAL